LKIYLYTDGSAKGNPGPGGFGAILKCPELKLEKEISQGFRLTTNNRMELLAVIKGLEALKKPGMDVVVISDSKYVVDSVTKGWVFNWVKINFKDKKNPDLWKMYLELHKIHKITFKWIKGHAGHPENERCDQLAVAASDQKPLLIDLYFEQHSS